MEMAAIAARSPGLRTRRTSLSAVILEVRLQGMFPHVESVFVEEAGSSIHLFDMLRCSLCQVDNWQSAQKERINKDSPKCGESLLLVASVSDRTDLAIYVVSSVGICAFVAQ